MNKEAKKFVKEYLKGWYKVLAVNAEDTTSQSYYVKNGVVLFKTFYMFTGKQSDFAFW